MSEEIQVIAETRNGIPYREAIPAEKITTNHYRILASPGFANGFAAGDVLEILDKSGNFRVVERSGNVCVQIFFRGGKDGAMREFGSRFGALGGWLDGGSDNENSHLLIYTIPHAAGFQAIEDVFKDLSKFIDLDKWMYGNVYDDNGVPLNWWVTGSGTNE